MYMSVTAHTQTDRQTDTLFTACQQPLQRAAQL